MTTKNIEWLIGRLRAFSGTSLAPALMHQAADTLQSQAERVRALELDLDVQAGSIEAVQAVNARQAERIKELEWQLAEIEKAEPVIWAISYDGVAPYTLWHEGDGPLLDGEVKRQGGTTQKLALFTRPMPVQSAEHCLWARNGHEPCQHVKPMQDVTELVDALKACLQCFDEMKGRKPSFVEDSIAMSKEALSKFKGAK